MGIGDVLQAGVVKARDLLEAITSGATPALALLTAGLLFRREGSVVELRFTFSADPGAELDEAATSWAGSWEVPYDAFVDSSAPQRLVGRLPALRIPDDLVTGLRYRLAHQEVPAGKPLWLKLARPYGALGTAPWEAALSAALDRPVLRLPDYPERPVERKDALEAAVIVDAEPGADPGEVAQRAVVIVQATLDGSSRPTTHVHVFPAAAWHAALAESLRSDHRVTVHDPAATRTSAEVLRDRHQQRERRDTPLRSAAWIDWVSERLKERALDVVHFLTRAEWSQTGSVLCVAGSPSPKEGSSALAAVDLDEVVLLLDRAGAWAATFTPPTSAYAGDVAAFADALARLRPGAVLYHSGSGADAVGFAAACRLLLGGKASAAPRLTAGFLHCHPSFITEEHQPDAGRLLDLLAENASVVAERAPWLKRLSAQILPEALSPALKEPPAWAATLQRQLESSVLEQMRRAGGNVLLSGLRPGTAEAWEMLATVRMQAGDAFLALQSELGKLKGGE